MQNLMAQNNDFNNFPLLSQNEFNDCCRLFVGRLHRAGLSASICVLDEKSYVEISTVVQHFVYFTAHIVLSAVYSVPVLYFQAIRLDEEGNSTPITKVSELQDQFLATRATALHGSTVLTQGEHPLTGLPWFFIHPCNTAEIMRDLNFNMTRVSFESYLPLWFGVVGPIVGFAIVD
ncbi:uncharacterized protein V1516DRAFT_671004 [Lipomyces oligophaga]|uniref:uncharacterized protein n=1 Tax=Lipomyces oligophaga TaxID=45792 RepID=UPI0034CDB6E7